MDAAGIFLILCVLGASWNVVTTLIVYGALQKRGLPVSFLWLPGSGFCHCPGYCRQFLREGQWRKS